LGYSNFEYLMELANFYLFDQVPALIPTFLPITTLAATTLLVIRMRKNHEWVAITSGSLSVARLMSVPLGVMALLASGIYYLNQEHWLHKLEHVSLKERPLVEFNEWISLNAISKDNYRFQCAWRPKNKRRVNHLLLVKPNEFIITAESAIWYSDEKKWKMKKVIKHHIDLETANPEFTSYHDHWEWASDLSIKDLIKISKTRDYMSREQLLSLSHKYPEERFIHTMAYFRFSEYLICAMVLFVGFPLVMSTQTGIEAALYACVCCVSILCVYDLFFSLAVEGLPIIISSMLPPLICITVGLYFWRKMPS
jgi:lipopolysaccharide export LptBFGC system permease protein LptF